MLLVLAAASACSGGNRTGRTSSDSQPYELTPGVSVVAVIEATKYTQPTPTSTPTLSPTRTAAPAATTPSTPQPTSTPSPVRTASTAKKLAPRPALKPDRTRDVDPKQGIQAVVNRYYRALNNGDLPLYESTIDPTNEYWLTIQQEQYRIWSKNYGDTTARAQVQTAVPVTGPYYRARMLLSLRTRDGRYGHVLQSWIFRRVGNSWKVTEPTAKQLGALRSKRGAGVTIEYYDWDRASVDRVLALSERALAKSARHMNVRPKRNVYVRLLPAYEVSPGLAAGLTVGYYRTSTPNLLFLRSPGSYGFGVYSPYDSPYAELEMTAAHELTHLLSDRRVRLTEITFWMSEGLAEWVADRGSSYELERALREGELFELSEMTEYSAVSSNLGLAYGQSKELVTYLIERYGIEGYWRLVEAYESSGQLDSSFRKALKVSADRFEQDWKNWVRTKYRVEGGP